MSKDKDKDLPREHIEACWKRPFLFEEALIGEVQDWLQILSKGHACNQLFVLGPLLSVVGYLIGPSASLRLTPAWTVNSILWSIIVARSGMSTHELQLFIHFTGSNKSGASSLITGALNSLEDKLKSKQEMADKERLTVSRM